MKKQLLQDAFFLAKVSFCTLVGGVVLADGIESIEPLGYKHLHEVHAKAAHENHVRDSAQQASRTTQLLLQHN